MTSIQNSKCLSRLRLAVISDVRLQRHLDSREPDDTIAVTPGRERRRVSSPSCSDTAVDLKITASVSISEQVEDRNAIRS